MYRPLSPHILIYKSQWNTISSILHRFSGIFLSLSLILFIFVLKFIIYHINFYFIYLLCASLNAHFSWLFISFCFILIFSFFLHFIGGLRHFIWDYGLALNKTTLNNTTFFTLFLTFFLSFLFFFLLN